MKLEINDYIRLNGFISKVDYINKSKNGNEYIQFKEPSGMIAHINSKLIKKASCNIIDLIEENDFINHMYVNEIKEKNDKYIKFMADSDYEFVTMLRKKDICSILTHEQFENNCYKIEGDN